MKRTIRFWVGAMAVAMFAAGCAKDTPVKTEYDGPTGVITVGIKADAPTRSLISDGALVEAFENSIKGFDVYVFDWTSGFLEASGTSPDGSPVTIPSVPTVGQKRVVVIANGSGLTGVPALPNNGLSNYDELADAYVSLTEQLFADNVITGALNGLLMTGENAAGFTVLEGSNNPITIEVARVVAKIELGSITFDDGINLSDLLKFNISDVSIQGALSATTIGTGAITPITDPAPTYYGGFELKTNGDPATVTTETSTQLTNGGIDLLGFIGDLIDGLDLTITVGGIPLVGSVLDVLEDILGGILPVTGLDVTLGTAVAAVGSDVSSLLSKVVNGFWYVLPNDGSTGKPTMLTLKGEYDGVDYFYPVEINTPASNPTTNGGDAGTYIKRNTRYVLDIEFKNLIGTDDPDVPGKKANMVITVTPKDWEGPVQQTTTW